jgi:dTDP-4-dehydrorhamnose reductase
MRVLITGAGGQLATELVRRAPPAAVVRSVSRAECDITDHSAVERVVTDFQPDTIINTAAYTAVDLAEDARDEAYAVNAEGPKNVARAARGAGARVIHISTDYVFDGQQAVPYRVDARPNPLNVYGASKLAGELAVIDTGPQTAVVRCGWLYSATGKNFLRTILGRLTQPEALRVVDDQIGVPTSARDFVAFLWWLAQNPTEERILHWANSGEGSWYDFAAAIGEVAVARHMVDRTPPIQRIKTADRPARAKRPPYSVLDATLSWQAIGKTASHWREALALTLAEMTPANARET